MASAAWRRLARMAVLAAALLAVAALLPMAAQAADWPTTSIGDGPGAPAISMDGVSAYILVKTVDDMATPVLVVESGGKEVLRVNGMAPGWEVPPGEATIVEMDPSNPYPEVVFTSFSGGAHCCTNVQIAVSDGTGKHWEAVEAGDFDGGGENVVSDADGDGRGELVLPDNAFYYAFDCYACSAAPLTVKRLEGRKLRDVSREPRYERLMRDHLAGLESWGTDQDIRRSNGYLAGWVASKSLVGEGAEAWATMLKSYDRSSDWGLETCKRPQPDGSCPQGQSIRLTFPEALAAFLAEHGYRL
ncbi:MAG TPA: hypothetical protein PLJ34_03690 [Hyphomicrobiales bacterium]|nr:hypothetical protein [Hyphomicrobiales bacterium]